MSHDPNTLTLRAFERSLKTKNRSPRTIQNYAEAALQLADHHDGADLADLEKPDIEAYLVHVLEQYKATTAANRFRSLRALYNWMVREEILDRSPMTGMTAPTVTDEPPPVLDDDKLRALLKACNGKDFDARRDTAILRLWCEPGSPRLAEMAGLALDDVDLDRDVVRVRGKGDKIRVVPFGAKTGQALDRYLRLRQKHRLAKLSGLWLGARGQALTPSGLTQMLRRRAADAGVGHVHPHQFRHTSAHVWYDGGGSEADADELFGWSAASGMSRVYGRSARTSRAHRASRRMSPADRL